MKSPIVIHLNGTPINGRIDGIDAFNISLRENDDDGGLAKSYSSELRFFDDGYSILKTALIDNPNGFANTVDIDLYDECCGQLVFSGFIAGDGIDWCEPECWISTQVVEKKPVLNCVKSTLITDNHNGFLNQPQKKLRYCVETRPDFLYSILFLIYGILNTLIFVILIPLTAVVVVIQSIAFIVCSIVCAVSPGCTIADCQGGTWTNPVGAWSEITGWFNDLRDRMIQCQWYHPTALVRDYIKNVCDKCGLQFESSILNDPSSPYYNLLLFSALVQKGYKPSQTEGKLIEQNWPIETLDTLMKRHLNPMFNAKYWIVGNKLIFERKDYFTNAPQWIDGEQLLNDGRIVDNEICFSYIDKEKYSFAEYKYTPDGIDIVANEAGGRFEDIVEWNPPPTSPTQSGSLELTLQSSMARFRWDGAGIDNLEQLVYTSLIFVFPFIPTINASRGLLLMSQHTAANYKFLIWDPDSGDENARVKTNYDVTFTNGNVFRPFVTPGSDIFLIFNSSNITPPANLYNYPMMFGPNANNLYTLFHYIDNPRLAGAKIFNFNFTYTFECGEFNTIDFSKTIRLRVGNTIKFGEIKELQIDFVKRTIGVSGIV